MAITKYRYYFGPAGDLQILPSVIRGAEVEPSPVTAGAITQSLDGTPTQIIYGAKRTWNLSWDMRTEENARPLLRLEAALRKRMLRRFYFMDAKNTNFLSPDVSVCAAEGHPKNSFVWTGGVVGRSFSGIYHAEMAGHVDGVLSFQAAAIGNQLLSRPMTPILAGSQYLFSGIFSGTGTMSLTFAFYDSAGAFLSVVSGPSVAVPGSPTVVTLSQPSGTVPVGAATFRVGVTAVTATPLIFTQGWMVQFDQVSRPAEGWYPGAGACEAIVASYRIQYPTYKMRSIAASIMEVA